jgi:hypothetical protein
MKTDEFKYEALNPWADADPIPVRGISPRIASLGKATIGLYSSTYKTAARRITDMVAKKLKQRFPDAKFSWFDYDSSSGMEVTLSDKKDEFIDWVKGVDVVIAAVGD